MKRNLLVVLFLLMLLISAVSCGYLREQLPAVDFLPVVQLFEATPSVVDPGEVAHLRWSVLGANSVFIDGGIGSVAVTGSIPISPSTTTFYTLTASNAIGTATARTQIIVTGSTTVEPTSPALNPPVIDDFYADRLIVPADEYAVLGWETSDATEVTLVPGGPVAINGTITVYPTATTTYVLTATNAGGSSSAAITITVSPAEAQLSGSEFSVTLPLIAEESGSLVKTGDYLNYGKYKSVCAGDTSSNWASRAFLSFDISSIPSSATVKEAILDLSDYTKTGDPTYKRSMWGNMGALEVYHLQYGKFEDLNFAAYNEAAKLTQGGSFIDYPLSPWSWDVKNASDEEPILQNLVTAGQSRCQFRIQFFTSTNWDSISDMLCFDNAKLTIKYTLPQ